MFPQVGFTLAVQFDTLVQVTRLKDWTWNSGVLLLLLILFIGS